jgi:hypothetical protein
LRNVNILFYSGNQIPNNNLLKLLEERFSDFEERFPSFVKVVEEIAQEMITQTNSLSLQDIQRRLKAYSTEETVKILETPEIESILNKNQIIFITSFGLVNNNTIKSVKDFLTEKSHISLESLKNQFPEIKDSLISICQNVGCSVKFKSINEVEIVYPK